MNIKVNLENTGIDNQKVMEYKEKVKKIDNELREKANDEKEFLGWIELPTT